MSAPIKNGDSTQHVDQELRAHPRLPAHGLAYLRFPHEPSTAGIRVILNDISCGGVNFTIGREMTIGDQIVLTLQPDDARQNALTIGAEVRWVASNVRTGQSRVGCSWSRQLSNDEMIRFTRDADTTRGSGASRPADNS